MTDKSSNPLEFHFTSGSSNFTPIPCHTAYDLNKKQGSIRPDMTYKEFCQLYCKDLDKIDTNFDNVISITSFDDAGNEIINLN